MSAQEVTKSKMIKPMMIIKLLIIIIITVQLDQSSKYYVLEYFQKKNHFQIEGQKSIFKGSGTYIMTPDLPQDSVVIMPFFNISFVWNRGVAFGVFNDVESFQTIITSLSLIVVLLFLYWIFSKRPRFDCMRFCGALIIGGAIGNIIDRMKFGAVFDFLDFHALGYHYHSFNIADSAIVIGIFIMILIMYRLR